jgi:hypothetical protein
VSTLESFTQTNCAHCKQPLLDGRCFGFVETPVGLIHSTCDHDFWSRKAEPQTEGR